MSVTIPRFFPYPIMTSNGIDYAEEHSYETTQLDPVGGKNSVRIQHRVKGKNFVSQLISDGQANFACTVVAPWCAYRRIVNATNSPSFEEEEILLQQEIELETMDFTHPVMFQPAVITSCEIKRFEAKTSHGFDKLWIGEEIEVPKAAMIAIEPFWNARNVVQSILKVKRDEDGRLRPGSFEVTESAEQGFYFLVEVAPDLYEGLLRPGKSFRHQESIYCAALSQGLDILCRKYKDVETWNEHQNLRLLYSMLKEQNVQTWDEEDFKPNQAVAAFHPHQIDVDLGNEEYDSLNVI